jgi:hypothetical protein
MEKWYLLQEWVASQLKELDPNARSTKASGACNEKGDVKNNCKLNIECKCYNKKNVYNQDWLDKAQSEIPLHSDRMAVVITENNEGKKVAHLDAVDFFNLIKENKRGQ